MGYPKTGNEVYVSFSLSNTMFSGIGKGTITRELVSVDYLKDLFQKYGVIVSAKPEQRRLLELVNEAYGLGLEIPDTLKLARLSEKNRRLVLISVQGLKRVNGSLLPSYSEEEFQEATFEFVKYYVQSRHYDDLVAENNKLKSDLESPGVPERPLTSKTKKSRLLVSRQTALLLGTVHAVHMGNQVQHFIGVPPLVIIPSDQLDKAVIQHDTRGFVQNGGVGIANDIGGHDLISGIG